MARAGFRHDAFCEEPVILEMARTHAPSGAMTTPGRGYSCLNPLALSLSRTADSDAADHYSWRAQPVFVCSDALEVELWLPS
jgi:hypothetical protein